MTDGFENSLLNGMRSIALPAAGERVLLAVSGGADSTAMAWAMHRLCTSGQLGCVGVIGHVHHGLRGAAADADEAFVRALAGRLGMPVAVARVDVGAYATAHSVSIETAARTLRLRRLAQMAARDGCRAVATAHHADDQAETVLHRLLRGTGFRGLCGIAPVSTLYGGTFIRPLLGTGRAAVLAYCRDHALSFQVDASNADTTFTRNRIRHRLLPALTDNAPALAGRLGDLSQAARRLLTATAARAEAVIGEGQLDCCRGQFTIDTALLAACPPWVFYEAVRGVLVGLGAGLRDYSQRHFDAIGRMLDQPAAKADFPDGVSVAVDKGRLRFDRKTAHSADETPELPVTLPVGQSVRWGAWTVTARLLDRRGVDVEAFWASKDSRVEWLDADRVTGPLTVRRRRDGDRFRPIGAAGEKKVARFLLDAQLDASARRNTLVIEDAKAILWLAPLRLSERVKVTARTRHILELRLDHHAAQSPAAPPAPA